MSRKGLIAGLVLVLAITGCSSGSGTTVGKDIAADSAEDLRRQTEVTSDVESGVDTADTAETTAPACFTHEDCQDRFPDLGPCELALCDGQSQTCVIGHTKDGATCDDGLLCTGDGYCLEGECQPGPDALCHDGDPCTEDGCNEQSGCTHSPLDEGACDDANPCTVDDACVAGVCTGTPENCECEADEDCLPFEDDDLCTGTLRCVDGGCLPDAETVPQCPSPDDPCLVAACDPVTGSCTETPAENGNPCSDGDSCTFGDACQDGVCQAGSQYVCVECESDLQCAYLDGANMCLGEHICQDGKCVIDPESLPVKPEIVCYDAVCNPDTGLYGISKLPDGSSCNDQDACTLLDQCQDGLCKGTPVDCDDANPCTQDGCDEESGCFHEPLTGDTCDDGNACTLGELCQEGECTGGAPLDCDDANPCTEDTCETESGCLNEPLSDTPCDDGQSCTEPDLCQDGVCVPGGNICQCQADGDCAQFDDLDLCNGSLHCVANECVIDPQTIVICDTTDDTDCEYTVCNPVSGTCGPTTAPYGSPCDDGNECTLGETCFFGDCLGGILVTCDDGNPCSADLCDPDVGCLFTPISDEPCDDGDPCTGDDICQEGECTPGENVCGCTENDDCLQFEDGNLCNGTLICINSTCQVDPNSVIVCPTPESTCMKSTCKPSTGLCVDTDVKDGTPCDDGDICTEEDTCVAGICEATPLDCDDGNTCTQDSCADEGCLHQFLEGEACEDGNPCTESDICQQGECVPGTNVCNCQEDADCADSDDSNLCNGSFICVDNQCTIDPETVVECDSSTDTECLKNLCNPATGECGLQNLPDGTACNDGLLCTEADACSGGQCNGDLVDCDDDNPCTDDICVDDEGGCVHLPNTASCDDSDACTANDFCHSGNCEGSTIQCDDNNPCTTDSCDPEVGCLFAPNTLSCDDGNACTENDSCNEGSCLGSPANCDDNNPCTDDSCDPESGCVSYGNNEPCEDGNPCTLNDTCGGGECQPGAPASCDDGNPCTQDYCDPTGDGCQNAPLSGSDCDDGNPCTDGDTCAEGLCVAGPSTDCDDGNPCTDDSCDPETGCFAVPLSGISCNDNNACTVNDVCTDGSCEGGLISCDDNNPCTEDVCDPAQGCLNPATSGNCDDGNACTLTDKCQGGQCIGSNTVECNDDNICTDDACDPATGQCLFVANAAPCNDNNPCTVTDQCANKLCVGSGTLDCSDNNPCTDDSCNPLSGCVHEDNGECQCVSSSECPNDGNACNGVQVCQDNVCVTDPASIVYCSPDNDSDCLKNTCQPDSGQCLMTPEPEGTTCNSANACITNTHCDGNGSCIGTPLDCDDGNVCTNDSCSTQSGCVHVNNALPCDDGNPCTVADQCGAGECQPGSPFECDDANVCTKDVCYAEGANPACSYVPKAGLCNDGNACTKSDACMNGSCTGSPVTCNDDNACTADSCDPDVGCIFTNQPDGTPCWDNEPCTEDDACLLGQCAPGDWIFGCCHTNADCTDQYGCTTESCVEGFCVYSLQDCGDGNDCTADPCVNGQCSHSPLSSPVLLYSEDFENGNAAGWLFDVEGGYAQEVVWSVDDNTGDDSVFSLYAGDPASYSYDFGDSRAHAYTPPIQLPADTGVDLTFSTLLDVEDQACEYDYVRVQVVPPTGSPVSLTPRICTSSESFVDHTYFLDDFAGQTVRIRFSFITGDALYNTGLGAFVDNVNVVALPRQGCCFFDGDCSDGDVCSGDLCQDFECTYPWTPGTYFQEDFESGSIPLGSLNDANSWYLYSDNKDVVWQVDDERAFSTPHSLYCGNPDSHTYDYGATQAIARTPIIPLPENSQAMLKFRLWSHVHQVDCNTDIFKVGVSTGTNEATQWLYQQCGSTNGFNQVEVNLNAFSGQGIYLVFRFEADEYKNAAEGIYVDHIRVERQATPQTCCNSDSPCNDNDPCTMDSCVGTPGGGVCVAPPVLDELEDFEDMQANGWLTYGGSPNGVTWQVSKFRAFSGDWSYYCGNASTQKYIGFGAGTVTAATPFFDVDAAPNLNAFLSFRRFLDLYASSKHCFTVSVQQKYIGTPVVLSSTCGDNFGGNTWTLQTHSLNAYKGKSIQVRFTLSFEACIGCFLLDPEGAYIDDVYVGFEGCGD